MTNFAYGFGEHKRELLREAAAMQIWGRVAKSMTEQALYESKICFRVSGPDGLHVILGLSDAGPGQDSDRAVRHEKSR